MIYVMGVDIGFANTGISLFKLNIKSNGYTARLIDVCLIETEKDNKKKNIRVADDTIRRITEITQGFVEFYNKHIKTGDKIVIFAEAPTGGGKSAQAVKAMGIATAIPAVLFEIMNLPVEYVSPNDVKIAVTGKRTASKQEIMEKVCNMVNGEVVIEQRNHKGRIKNIYKYIVCDQKFGLNFEHIADSVGAVLHGKKKSQMFKMLLDVNKLKI